MATKKNNTGEDPLVLGLLRQVLSRLDETNTRMDAGFKEVRAEIGVVSAEVQGTNARMDAGFKEVNARFDEVDARIDGVVEDVKQVRAEVQAVDAGLGALREEVKAMDVSLGALRQDMEHVPAQVTSIKADVGSQRGEFHQDLEDHRKRIESLEKLKRTGTR